MKSTDTVFVWMLDVASPWAAWIDLNLFHNLFFSALTGSHISVRGGCSGKRQHTFPLALLTGYKEKDHRAFSLWTIQKFRQWKKKHDSSLLGSHRDKSASCSPISICLSSETSQLLLSVLTLSPLVSYLPCSPPLSGIPLPAFLHL